MPGQAGPTGRRGEPGEQGPAGRPGDAGRDAEHGKDGAVGKMGEAGPDGTNGIEGSRGPPGKEGAQGDAGDQVKNELQTHLNALKGYVDMKFDVLKGMMAGDEKAGGEELNSLSRTMQESMVAMEML